MHVLGPFGKWCCHRCELLNQPLWHVIVVSCTCCCPRTTRLTQAVEDESIDILAVQAPPCKGMPAHITDLLHNARTSVLVFPSQTDINES